MLKTILSISGRPGLFKLVSNNKNMIIVESLQDNKKLPVHARDRIVSLGDISIYTESDEVALKDILLAIKNKENGKPIVVPSSSQGDIIKKYFGEILPEYDKDRVHISDMRKIYTWYNLLVNANIEFDDTKTNAEEAKEEVEVKEKAKETKTKETKAKETKAKETKPKETKVTKAKETKAKEETKKEKSKVKSEDKKA